MEFPALSRLPFDAAAFVVTLGDAPTPDMLAGIRDYWDTLRKTWPDLPPLIVLPAGAEWDVITRTPDGTLAKASKVALAVERPGT